MRHSSPRRKGTALTAESDAIFQQVSSALLACLLHSFLASRWIPSYIQGYHVYRDQNRQVYLGCTPNARSPKPTRGPQRILFASQKQDTLFCWKEANERSKTEQNLALLKRHSPPGAPSRSSRAQRAPAHTRACVQCPDKPGREIASCFASVAELLPESVGPSPVLQRATSRSNPPERKERLRAYVSKRVYF